MPPKKVLVTGCGGYLGSILVPTLLDEGYEVVGLDRFYFGRSPVEAVAGHPGLRLVEGDVRTLAPALLDGVAAVIHLASLSSDPSCELNPDWTHAVNEDASIRLARLAAERGVERFLFASSCSVYGSGGDDSLDESSTLRPVSLYARLKASTEQAIMRMAGEHFCPVSLRCATLFGLSPRMRFDLVINLMTLHATTKHCIYVTGGGEQWRPLLHVRDAARAYLRSLELPAASVAGKWFNVSAGNFRVHELALKVAQVVGGVEVIVVPDDPDRRKYRVTAAQFEKAAVFAPRQSVEDGIREIAAALASGQLPDIDHPRYYTLRTLREAMERPAAEDGEPVRATFLGFSVPSIGHAEEAEVLDTLRSGWLTTGPKTRRFEDLCRAYIGSRHAIAVSSCTAALHLALLAMRISPGDEVITSPISWPSTANVVLHQGGLPVFVDVEEDTLNLDATKIEAAITPRTRAIIAVHMAGQPCDMEAIHAVARRHHLVVIEDAAHAIGAAFGGRKIGTLSPFTAFSFYPTKNITTGEGGLLTLEDDDVADRVRTLSLHGITKDAWKRYSAEGSVHWQLVEPGYKYNMTDIQAALGLHQLPRLDEFIETRYRWARVYDGAFAEIPGVRPLALRPGRRHAHHLYVVRLDVERIGMTRDGFVQALKAENIGTGVHFISMHLQPYYRDVQGLRPEALPVARRVSERIVSLPLYPAMTAGDVQDVITAVRKVLRGR
ncbi:MAG: aminotransferase class I/II-fold pyridoxal phosphate-dependent enzyme [Myxococcales bacterium]|nr:aminotransferase class I/II-fold pyridoxal phosphate-dependent enzyme [Myxococcales bacterium]